MNKLQYLVIHCTATPEGRDVTGAEIRDWHTSPPPRGRGWRQVGYTDLIRLDGSIERLVSNNDDAYVDQWEITNGVAGKNSVCRHIVYAGGLDKTGRPKDTRTPAQVKALTRFLLDFHRSHPHVAIVGHRDLDKGKACPSFDVRFFLTQIGI